VRELVDGKYNINPCDKEALKTINHNFILNMIGYKRVMV
jgi:hypothetical protein